MLSAARQSGLDRVKIHRDSASYDPFYAAEREVSPQDFCRTDGAKEMARKVSEEAWVARSSPSNHQDDEREGKKLLTKRAERAARN